MPKVNLYDMSKNIVGELQLSDVLFNAEYNESVIHQSVVTRLANEDKARKAP